MIRPKIDGVRARVRRWSMQRVERRRSRSSRPIEALSFFLNRARRSLGVRALTLGTTSGHLIAGSGDDLDRVAEAGAEVDSGAEASEPIATWRMQLGGTPVVLTSLGGALDPELGTAVRRILAG
jgi:hypothetical protein